MLAVHKVLLFGAFLLCLSFYRRFQRLKRVWRFAGNVPAYFVLISPFTPVNDLLPRIPLIVEGPDFSWRDVYERESLHSFPAYLTVHVYLGIFMASKSDIVQLRSVFWFRVPRLLVADATAVKVRPISKS